jgi:hypothetical protein
VTKLRNEKARLDEWMRTPKALGGGGGSAARCVRRDCVSVCLCVCLSMCLSVCVSMCLSVSVCVCPYV